MMSSISGTSLPFACPFSDISSAIAILDTWMNRKLLFTLEKGTESERYTTTPSRLGTDWRFDGFPVGVFAAGVDKVERFNESNDRKL